MTICSNVLLNNYGFKRNPKCKTNLNYEISNVKIDQLLFQFGWCFGDLLIRLQEMEMWVGNQPYTWLERSENGGSGGIESHTETTEPSSTLVVGISPCRSNTKGFWLAFPCKSLLKWLYNFMGIWSIRPEINKQTTIYNTNVRSYPCYKSSGEIYKPNWLFICTNTNLGNRVKVCFLL